MDDAYIPILILLGFGMGIGMIFLLPQEECPEPICESPQINLSCPEPKCPKPNITKVFNIELPYNNIQPSHHNLDYSLNGDDFCIDNIDTYGEIVGLSMQPTIFTGNILIEKKYRNEDLDEGDIIRFKREDGYAIHRIKGDYTDLENYGYFITQGDNNRYDDGKVYPENITHIVIGVLYG